METYEPGIAPPGGSPELPGSEPTISSSSKSGCVSKMTVVIVAVMVALVSAGVAGGLAMKYSQPECTVQVDGLVKQATADKDAMRAKLNELKEDLAAAERAAMGVALGVKEEIIRISDSDRALFVSHENRFAASIDAEFEIDNAVCRSDASDMPTLSRGKVPTVALTKTDEKGFFFVPGYHYEIIDENETSGCRKVNHDLAWLEENTFATSLVVHAGLEDEAAVRDFLGDRYGARCGELAEFKLVDGHQSNERQHEVVMAQGEVVDGSPECFISGGLNLLYSPVTKMLFVVPFGNDLDTNVHFPTDIIAL